MKCEILSNYEKFPSVLQSKIYSLNYPCLMSFHTSRLCICTQFFALMLPVMYCAAVFGLTLVLTKNLIVYSAGNHLRIHV